MSPIVEIKFANGSTRQLSDTSHRRNDKNSQEALQASLFLCGETGQCLREIDRNVVEIKEVADRLGLPCSEGFHRDLSETYRI